MDADGCEPVAYESKATFGAAEATRDAIHLRIVTCVGISAADRALGTVGGLQEFSGVQ